ncbi:MAG: SDR family NAD(P)-dependent oxidoreductase, partial [Pseudomonadota bacterium]
RDMLRLEEIAQSCRELGATTSVRAVDLADLEHALAVLGEDDDLLEFGTAVFAAGIGDIRGSGERIETPHLIARLATVNYTAPAALAAELANRMAARGRGNIALIGSAASFHALPFATGYASSKAGLARFAEALGIAMRPFGVRVTLISPGFIDTEAARRVPGPKPMILTPDEAAQHIARAVGAGKAHVILPWPFALLRVIDRLVPGWLRARLLRGLAPRE